MNDNPFAKTSANPTNNTSVMPSNGSSAPTPVNITDVDSTKQGTSNDGIIASQPEALVTPIASIEQPKPTETPISDPQPVSAPIDNQQSAPAPVDNQQPTPAPVQPRKKSPAKLALTIGLPIIAIITGALIWYFAYFTNKNVVISQAINNLLTTRDNQARLYLSTKVNDSSIIVNASTAYTENGDSGLSASVSGYDVDNKEYEVVSSDLTRTGSNNYFRVSLGDQVLQLLSLLGIDETSLTSLNGQWIKVTDDELDKIATENDSKIEPSDVWQCSQTGINQLNDSKYRQELIDALLNSGFIVIGDANSDGDGQYYELSLDTSRTQDAYNKIINSQYYRTVNNCLTNKGFDNLVELKEDNIKEIADELASSDPRIKLYITEGFNRQLTRIKFESKYSDNGSPTKLFGSLEFTNKKPTIEAPKKSMTIDEVTKILNSPSTNNSLSSDLVSDTNNKYIFTPDA
ncbi:MAG: hypothetical protein Q4C83_01910 [Candidatus Saccharibacteria bacterium]|nr:hypothetical protein [Candidatus Saccharibacteria bacterium]